MSELIAHLAIYTRFNIGQACCSVIADKFLLCFVNLGHCIADVRYNNFVIWVVCSIFVVCDILALVQNVTTQATVLGSVAHAN